MVETARVKQRRLPQGDLILGVPDGARGAILRTRAGDLAMEWEANQAAAAAGEADPDFGLQARYYVASILSAGYDNRAEQVALGMQALEDLERQHPEVGVALAMDRSLGVPALNLVRTIRATRRVVSAGAGGGTVK